MGYYYEEGEIKKRAGVYRRYDTDDERTEVPDAINGVGVMPIHSDWGPLNKVIQFDAATADKDITALYGTGGTVDAALSFVKGGLTTIMVYRLGSGGGKGTVTLTSSNTKAVTLTSLYPGTRDITVSIKAKLASTAKEMIVYDGVVQKETISFEASDGISEAKALETAVNLKSKYFTAKAEDVDGAIDIVAQENMSGGTLPTVTNEDYSKSFEAFEPYPYNTLALDTIDESVQKLLLEYLLVAHNKRGKECNVCIGDTTDTTISSRMEKAKKYNSELIEFFGSGFFEFDGTEVKGVNAVARAAGVIAATPSNQSITHMKIPGAVSCNERLLNDVYEDAIDAGMLLLAEGTGGQIWFDSGYNTLKNLAKNQDEGWKKIKRTKVRQEMFSRIDIVVEPLIGKVNNISDGIDRVRSRALRVLSTMAGENKIKPGATFELAPEGYNADFAYFNINAVDVETLEKIYLLYKFKHSTNS